MKRTDRGAGDRASVNRDGLSENARKVRIVIADDHTEVLMATADVISDCAGVEVVSLATNADEAVEAAASLQPDIVFVDAWLRGGGAEGVARRIQEVARNTVVVALASAKDLDLALRLRAAGAAGCYEKETLSAVLPGILAAARLR
jgi:DNA-binding NarL/FixJ family response regulator